MKTVDEIVEQFKSFYFIDIYTGERNQDRVLRDITEEQDEEIKIIMHLDGIGKK